MNRLRLIILGAPGSGKGTISKRIVNEFKVTHLSSGDLLRAHINQNTQIGQQVKQLVAKGQLVSDDLISKIYLQEVEKLGKQASWLLDGFPRTLNQCKAMENVHVDRVVNLNVPFEEIVNRLKHRWIHASSGRIYNLEFNPPKVAGKDDVTGEPLTQRNDDRPEVVLTRLKTYEQQIRPVIDYFASKNLVETFTGNTSDYLWPLIKNHLHNFLNQRNNFGQLSTETEFKHEQSLEKEPVTHTGQNFQPDDFRRARFESATRKLVNQNHAIDWVAADPVVVCDQRVVWSSGGGPLGHPKVYINLDKPEVHDCNYSGRRFVKKKYYDPAKHGKSITYEEYLSEMFAKEFGSGNAAH